MTGKLPPVGVVDPAMEAVLARLDTIERTQLPSLERRLRLLELAARAEATDEEVRMWDPGDTGELTPPAGGEGKGTGGAPPRPRA